MAKRVRPDTNLSETPSDEDTECSVVGPARFPEVSNEEPKEEPKRAVGSVLEGER